MAKTDQELAQEEVNNRQYMYGGLGPFSQFFSGQRREILRPESTQVAGFAAGPSGLNYITETIPAQYGPAEYDPSYSPVRRGLSALGDMLGETPSFLGLRGPDEQVEAIQGVGSSLRDALFGSAEYMSEQARAAASGGEYFDPETGRTVAFDPTITMFGGNPAEGAVLGSGVRAGRAGSNSARSRPDFDMDTTYYHGTSSDFTEFKPSEVGDLGPGIYMTTNPEKASGYAAVRKFMRRDTNDAAPNVMPLRLRKDLNFLDLQGRAIMPFDEDRIQRLRDSGYDGIRQLDESGNVTQLNIFDPKNIRSVNAEFKPGESANILYSGGRTGTGIAAGSSLGQLLQEQFPKDYDPRVIKSYTEAGIDPRTYAAGSGANTRKPLISQVDRNLSTDIQIGDQRIGDVPIINLEDYEGYPFISSMSDRSAAGDVIQSINGVPVNVSRRGGMDYMFDPESGELVWASAPDVLVGQERRSGTSVFEEPREKSILGRAIALREQTGKDPLFIPFSMAPTGVDFSQPAEVILSHARNALDLSDLNKLDADIKEVLPGFSGINSPDGMSQVNQASGDVRKKIINIINNDYAQKGALTSGQARAALLDQAQAMSRDSTLRNVGLIDTSRMITVGDVHPIYKGGLYGEGLGRLADPYSVYELNPQAAYLGGIRPDQLLNPPRSTGMGAGTRKLELSPLTGVITDDVLRGMEARRAQF